MKGKGRVASLKCQFQGVWPCQMKGARTEMDYAWKLICCSSISCDRRDPVKGESHHWAYSSSRIYEDMCDRLSDEGQKKLSYSSSSYFRSKEVSSVIVPDLLQTPVMWNVLPSAHTKGRSSPRAAKSSKTWMGGFVDERRDDSFHHVCQHSEGGHHDEVYEPWRHRQNHNVPSADTHRDKGWDKRLRHKHKDVCSRARETTESQLLNF